MSITDELREYTERQIKWLDMTKVHYRELYAIADRIDAAHESALYDLRREHDEWVADRDANWVTLPLDADGEVIHIGDVVEAGMETFKIERMLLTRWGWAINGGEYTQHEIRHRHVPTVEDVLQEMLYKAHIYDEREMELLPDLISEYAAKLRLADDEKEQ